MTKSKAVRLLVKVAPAIIAANAKPGPRCIMATRLGITALDALGVQAQPMPVKVLVHNFKMMQFLKVIERDKRTPTKEDWAALKADGGWTIDMGDPMTPARTDTDWPGHLVIKVPDQDLIIDLDLQAMNRPQKDIRLPQAAVFGWAKGVTINEYPGPGGCWIGIKEEPFNTGFMEAKDWSNRADDVAQEIVRAIRKGR